MAKFSGVVGYVQKQQTAPGVWTDVPTEYVYKGDILRNVIQNQSGTSLNSNLNISNRFSLVGDWFSYENFGFMKYIKWMNTYWEILSVEVQRPRLIISVGGVYNGPKV